MMIRMLGVLLLGFWLTACGDNTDAYRLDQISSLTASAQGGEQLKVSYHPRSESLHFSPGVTLSTHADHIEIRFVRCGIKDKCAVTHAAEVGSQGKLSVVIPRPTLPVRASDGKNTKMIYPAP